MTKPNGDAADPHAAADPADPLDRPDAPGAREDRIELRDLRLLGTHGLLPEERQRRQPFGVDLDIIADLAPAGRSDDIADTIDYGKVAEAVAAEVAGPPADLLERLAERIADRVLDVAGGRATAVTVTVRKLRPPVPVDLSSIGVRITRGRSRGPSSGPDRRTT